jgi:hypothetical protein
LSPFAFQLAYLGGLYLFFRHTLCNRLRWVALWLFSLGNWQQHNVLLPQAFAFVLLFLVLGSYARNLGRGPETPHSTADAVVTLVLFSAIVVSHLLTALIALGVMTTLHSFTERPRGALVVVALVIAASWTLYGSAHFLETNLRGYAPLVPQLLERIKAAFAEAVLTPVSFGSEVRKQVSMLRLLLMGLIFLVGMVGAALSIRSAKIHRADGAIAAIAVVISLFVLSTGLFSAGILNRVYAAVLPLVSYFGARTFHRKAKWMLALFLIVAGPLHIAAQEGNQIIDYIPHGYLEGLRFFHRHTTGGTVTEARALEGDPPPFGGFERREDYVVARYRTPHWEGILPAISSGQMGRPPSYVVTSDVLDRPVAEFLTGDLTIASRVKSALKSSFNGKVYENGAVTITLLTHP